MKHASVMVFGVCLSAILFTACSPSTPDHTAATEYWAQPDSVVVGIGQPADMAARSRDEVWVADLPAAAIFSMNPRAGEYAMIGAGDSEPAQIEQPVKLAVSPDIGLSAYDANTGSVDLLTFSGEFIRGFSPGFVPAAMGFSRRPLGYTFGVAAGDSGQERRSVVIHTDLQGKRPDTLLSPAHGPEALRGAVASQGETTMSPSETGMWVWSNTAPGLAFELSPRGARALALRPEDREGSALMADRVRDMLWVVRPGEDTITYAAYDARLARELPDGPDGERPDAAGGGAGAEDANPGPENDAGDGDAAPAFLGTRTTGTDFRPMTIHDGIVMGVRRIRSGIGMMAYDLHADEFERADPEGD